MTKRYLVVEYDDDQGYSPSLPDMVEDRLNAGEYSKVAEVVGVYSSNPAEIPPIGLREEDIPKGYEMFAPLPADTPYERGYKLGLIRQFNLSLAGQRAARGYCTMHVWEYKTATKCMRCGEEIGPAPDLGLGELEKTRDLAAQMAADPAFVKGAEAGWKAIEEGRCRSLESVQLRLKTRDEYEEAVKELEAAMRRLEEIRWWEVFK